MLKNSETIDEEIIEFLIALKKVYDNQSYDNNDLDYSFYTNTKLHDIIGKCTQLNLCRIEEIERNHTPNDFIVKITDSGLKFLERLINLKVFW